jgi:2-succinyl-5-enolpyruvyl-6-hydroxy-3-cyclohexene-1-carboxylate synthase
MTCGDAETTFRWAWALLDGLVGAGVRRAVISPGSRSTPLTLAALRHPGLTTHMVLDERSAAFFALGLVKAEAAPVAVIATSGSAVANWFPAVTEANMGRWPLILLSADRPPELQDCGANQTMDQIGLFGSHVRAFHHLPPAETETGWLGGLAARAVAAGQGPLPGPVHLNIPLREPLVPPAALPPARTMSRSVTPLASQLRPTADAVAAIQSLLSSGQGAILCGSDDLGVGFHEAVMTLGECRRVPVFADILSGVRGGAASGGTVLAHPDQVARTAPAADWVLRFGGAPISRAMTDWLGRCGGRPQVVVSAHPRPADPVGVASHVIHADPATLCRMLAEPMATAPGWRETFLELDRQAEWKAAAACADDIAFEGTLLRRLLSGLPPETALFLGNSLTVRAAEWFAGRLPHRLRLFGNRGVSGIDGNLSTAFGLAAGCGSAVAVVGDLALQHDLTALALGREHRLVVVVLDNGGGGIFDHLPQAGLPEYRQAWLMPQGLSIPAAAQAFGLDYVRAGEIGTALGAIRAALDHAGSSVVHLPIDRTVSLNRCREFHSLYDQGDRVHDPVAALSRR